MTGGFVSRRDIATIVGQVAGERLPNQLDQDIFEQSATQKFVIGSPKVLDERVYRYTKAITALVAPCTYRLVVATDQILAISDLLSVAPAAPAGGVTINLAVGTFQGGVVAKDEFKSGWAEIWPVAGGNQFMWRRIVANSAVSAGNFSITVDKPLNLAVGVASLVVVHPSIYRAVKMATDAGLAGFQMAVGVPPIPVAINNYFWLQTWGPCVVGPTGAFPLSIADYVDVYLHSDGCIHSSKGEAIGTNESPQRVGYVIGAGNYGTMSIMLQLER